MTCYAAIRPKLCEYNGYVFELKIGTSYSCLGNVPTNFGVSTPILFLR